MTGYRQQKLKNGLTKCLDLVDHYTQVMVATVPPKMVSGMIRPLHTDLFRQLCQFHFELQAVGVALNCEVDHLDEEQIKGTPIS